MAETIIDQFVVLFGLDSKGFAKGQRDIEDSSKKLSDSTKKTFDGIEQAGKGASSSVKGVATEVIGLGLAFFGMKSIVGFAADMLTGSAAADRMGQTLGMATGKVIAWRQAMGTVGGQEGDADASLRAVEKAMQDYQHFGSTGNDPLWMSLGINKKDLMGSDPGEVLQKLAAQRGNFSGPDFANRLQMLGLPDGMVNFLMQGGGAVKGTLDKYGTPDMLKQYQAQAKAAEDLQKTMNDLKVTIATDLVPAVTTIAQDLNAMLGIKAGGNPLTKHWNAADAAGAALKATGHGTIGDWISNNLGTTGDGKGWGRANIDSAAFAYFFAKTASPSKAMGIVSGINAEGGGLGMAANGAFGIGQWRGPRLRALRAKYGANPTLAQQLDFMWSEMNGGDHGGKSVLQAQGTEGTLQAYINNFMRPGASGAAGDIHRAHNFIAMAARAHAPQKVNQSVHIGQMHVHTQAKDGKHIARDIHHHLKHRVMVAQADTGVRP